MALNTQLVQILTGTPSTSAARMTSLMATGSSLISLSSQLLQKTMYYIRNKGKADKSRGINGFLFDVTKETVVNLSSDITDYPLEGDYQVQAHFSKRPVSITITGTCSDIRVHDPNDDWNLEKILDDATEMMEKISILSSNLQLGAVTRESQRVVAYTKTLDTLYRKIKETVNRINFMRKWFGENFDQRDDTTSQHKVYDILYNYWETGERLSVETPWTVYDNCVIERLSFTQPQDTVHQTEITVQFKQLTLIDEVPGMYAAVLNGKVYEQMAEEVKKTNDQPDTKSTILVESAKEKAKTDEDMKQAFENRKKASAKEKQGYLKQGKNKVDDSSTKKAFKQ